MCGEIVDVKSIFLCRVLINGGELNEMVRC